MLASRREKTAVVECRKFYAGSVRAQPSALGPPGRPFPGPGNPGTMLPMRYDNAFVYPSSGLAGRLRRVFPSPLQSNWRLYVDTLPDGAPAERTVLFVKNVFDHPLYALGSRLFSDALPSHLARPFTHTARDGRYDTRLAGSGGSAPDFRCTAERRTTGRCPTPSRHSSATDARPSPMSKTVTASRMRRSTGRSTSTRSGR
ncbi:hypothetical protein [Burkholderia sp. AU45388]|uniref:hypothetical protein n=1 Tax=Burkholderia sp. AU45388 TaxID=3059206 RepID=UPI00264ED035|nr:hypothetical protein [Burkholderia sp. AU45388]MDN7424735.1 hypothetical protein [Burkholderia sp. AU45388]